MKYITLLINPAGLTTLHTHLATRQFNLSKIIVNLIPDIYQILVRRLNRTMCAIENTNHLLNLGPSSVERRRLMGLIIYKKILQQHWYVLWIANSKVDHGLRWDPQVEDLSTVWCVDPISMLGVTPEHKLCAVQREQLALIGHDLRSAWIFKGYIFFQ